MFNHNNGSDFHVDTLTTHIVGLHHENIDGIDRCTLLGDYLSEIMESKDKYSGYSDQDMLSDGFYFSGRIYEFSYSEISTVKLVVESENIFDKDPIKVYHEKLKDLGYVPFIDKDRVRGIMDNKEIIYIELEVTGGKYKYIENGELKKGECSLGLMLHINYS